MPSQRHPGSRLIAWARSRPGNRARDSWLWGRLGPTGLLAFLVLIGAVVWIWPYMTTKRPAIAEVPTPKPIVATAHFAVPPSGRACISSVTIPTAGHLAEFHLQPVTPTPPGNLRVSLVLSAPGYTSKQQVTHVRSGAPVALPITPPRRDVIGTACFINEGHDAVLLAGSTEARTVARSPTQIDNVPVVGDIALTFLQRRPQSLADRLNEVFSHASNLTEALLPVWLIWVLAVLVAFGLPAAIIASLYLALREDSGRVPSPAVADA
ncbi:MAG: hypothetical protein ACYDA6_07125 [Solirubrobacteraceae bacterium]